MEYPTLLDLRTRVRRDLDLIDEPGITDDEIDEKLREGVNVAEATIHTMYGEDYFLTHAPLTITAGQPTVALPSDIYAGKVRAIIYENGSVIYEVRRIKGRHLFERLQRGVTFGNGDQYQWVMLNKTATEGLTAKFVPTPYETGSLLTCWYIRNANKMSEDTDVCDIPEFSDFIVAYAKNEIALDKPGLASPAITGPKAAALYEQMVDTLQQKVPDEGDDIPIDTEFYEDMS